MSFVVGMNVVLSARGREHYGNDKYNPHSEIGKVHHVYEENWSNNIYVTWENKYFNSYRKEHLERIDVFKNITLGDFL